MKLKTGQSVKVKKGILCPDDFEFDLSGWQGRLIDIEKDENGETIIDIAWDSITLKEMSEEYIVKCEADGLEWASMYLSLSDVEQVNERDSEKDTDKIRSELENRFGWIGMGEEGIRIQAVVNSAKNSSDREIMKTWGKYLEKHMKFPFESVVEGYQGRLPIRQGDKLRIFSIKLVDDEQYERRRTETLSRIAVNHRWSGARPFQHQPTIRAGSFGVPGCDRCHRTLWRRAAFESLSAAQCKKRGNRSWKMISKMDTE